MRAIVVWISVLVVFTVACGQGRRAETFGMGEPAADGQFTFTVTGYECGATRAGGAFINRQAQGTYCFLDVEVTNTGDEPRDLNAGAQRLVDDADREFAADFGASWLESEEWPARTVNPGSTMSLTVVFDVMAPSKIVSAELHDSPFSRGVVVHLPAGVSSTVP